MIILGSRDFGVIRSWGCNPHGQGLCPYKRCPGELSHSFLLLNESFGALHPHSLPFPLERIPMPLHWSRGQPNIPRWTSSPYEIDTEQLWHLPIFFICLSRLKTFILWASWGDSDQCPWLAVPGVELPPYKWGLGEGKKKPVLLATLEQSFTTWCQGDEKHQQPDPPWSSPTLETVDIGSSCLPGGMYSNLSFCNRTVRGWARFLLFLQTFLQWMFLYLLYTGRTDVEAETPLLWPPDAKSWLIWKDPDAGKDWGQEEKGMTEDEMVGWHHQLNGHGFGWTPGVGDGQRGLACCSSWGRKELDMTERLNWTELKTISQDFKWF